ncbi:MAG TPA: polysaccharide biosynthesis/export family protein [Phycisphaerae bacterium]|nr:polysaccharide biosynthesis/export family protein [Phycisphaerae bacterium]
MTTARKSKRITIAALSIAVFAIFGAGCGPKEHELNAFVHDWEATTTGTEHVVEPPDVIEITSPTATEIDGETHAVGADGKVTLRLLGQVKVAGLTPVEISRKLEKLLATYYVEPTVTVRMITTSSKRIYVFGQVARGGTLPFTGRDTVLSVLSEAQPTYLAWKDQIKLIRPSHKDKKRHVITVNAYKLMEQGDLSLNMIMQEGDVLYVPPSPLAWVGLRVQEVLFPIQPVAQTIITPGQTKVSYDSLYGSDND